MQIYSEVTEDLYKHFIDTGYISKLCLNLIAKKVANRIKLNTKEMAVFYAKTNEINEILKENNL
jgi:hypothetical protein